MLLDKASKHATPFSLGNQAYVNWLPECNNAFDLFFCKAHWCKLQLDLSHMQTEQQFKLLNIIEKA